MTPQAVYNGPDPLEWARKQLDFEAVAKRGPAPRDVLFKAQTIVPITRPRLQSKPLATTAGVLLVLAALLAPWLPQRTTLLTAHIVLDRQYTRVAAQELAYAIAKRLPESVLVGAQFTPISGVDENARGTLRLAFTGLDVAAGKLESNAAWAMSAMVKDDSAKLQRPLRLQSSSQRSPVVALWQGLAGMAARKTTAKRPGEALASNLLEHQQLVLEGLRKQLEQEGYAVSAAGYLDLSGTGSGSTHDMSLEAWPGPLGLSIEGYSALDERERETVRQVAQDFLNRMNLGAAPLAFTAEPQPWLPVLLEVRTPSGLPDRFLTDRLQARLKQPTAEELSRLSFDVVQLVDASVKDVLPGEEVRIDYQALRHGQRANRGELYLVTISLSGRHAVNQHELAGEEAVANEESIDW